MISLQSFRIGPFDWLRCFFEQVQCDSLSNEIDKLNYVTINQRSNCPANTLFLEGCLTRQPLQL